MKDVETLIFSVISTDVTLTGLIPAANILHGFQNISPAKPQLTFWQVGAIKGNLKIDVTQVNQLIYQFGIFSNDYLDVCSRLKRLFDNQIFDPLPSFTEADCIFSSWDTDLTDNFDENLKVKRKDCRVRFTVKLKALDPI